MAVADQSSVIPASHQRHWFAALLSLIIPGLGQISQRKVRRGFIFFALPSLSLFCFCHSGAMASFSGAALLLASEALIWLIAVLDALLGAAGESSARDRRGVAVLILIVLLVAVNEPPVAHWLMGDIRLFSVPSGDMAPTLQPGDIVVVSLQSSGATLHHREVVAFRHQGQFDAKRIIAMGGDRVQVQSGRVRLNGSWQDEPYIDLPAASGALPAASAEVHVPDGQLYVLGDSRLTSYDSHSAGYGAVTTGDVLGPVRYILFSPDPTRIGQLQP